MTKPWHRVDEKLPAPGVFVLIYSPPFRSLEGIKVVACLTIEDGDKPRSLVGWRTRSGEWYGMYTVSHWAEVQADPTGDKPTDEQIEKAFEAVPR